MDDDELAFWGEFGRRVTPEAGRVMPWEMLDINKLWNAFGALEEKVRAHVSQP